MESLGTLLEGNPIGLLLFYDELLAWIYGFNQYKGKGNDQQKTLSLWSGMDIQIDRKQQEAKIIVNPFITVTGGIQPDVLKDLSKGRNDGFLDRILFCYPDRIRPRYTRDKLDDTTTLLFHNRITELFNHSTDKFESNGFQSFKLTLSAEQFEVWLEWINSHHAETEAMEFPYYLKGSWMKMEAHSLRLILLLAYSRTQPDEEVEIRMQDVEGGIKLAAYFKTHIRKTYQEIHSTEIDKRILKAVEFLKLNGGFTTYRNFYKCGIAGCKGPKDTNALFEEMEARELGKRGKSSASPGAKQSDGFGLDPEIK